MKVLGYGCTSSAGSELKDFWNGLCEGRDHSEINSQKISSPQCLWKTNSSKMTALTELVSQMHLAWTQVLRGLSQDNLESLRKGKVGVIFASTKGAIEDFIWNSAFSENVSDPLTPVLREFIRVAEITTDDFLCMSNACSSAAAAIYLAGHWLNQKRVDHVLVVTADKVGPFVTQGFSSLKALTLKKSKPFSGDRDGLQLGEAATAILLSNDEVVSNLTITGVAIDTEGYAVTRPSSAGESLSKVIKMALGGTTPDLIIAHGTGTIANDKTEDHVFFEHFKNTVPITATKWSIGHTLGSSAGMDLIAGMECLKNQRTFQISNTEKIDSEFKSQYLFGKTLDKKIPLKKVLVTSLGFGGVHGAILIEEGLK